MPTTEDYLKSLQNDKQNIINNIKAKGVNVPDNATFTDLVSKVENIPTGMTPTGTIDITKNGITDVTRYANANVNVPDGAWNYFNKKVLTGRYGTHIYEQIIKIPNFDMSQAINLNNFFEKCTWMRSVPYMDTSKVKEMCNMFFHCEHLEQIPLLNTSNVIRMDHIFAYCYKLKSIPLFDTSKVTSLTGAFTGCPMTEIPALNTSKVKSMSYMCSQSSSLEKFPILDTSAVTMASHMLDGCVNLKSLPELDFSSMIEAVDMLSYCKNLIDIGGFKNMGKNYDFQKPENDWRCQFKFTDCTLLTHQSLINIINNLYDIKAQGAKPQQLSLGTENLAKLTPEEIAIATNKGWNVS